MVREANEIEIKKIPGQNYLVKHGFDLRFVFDIAEVLNILQPAYSADQLARFSTVILFAHGGPNVWSAMKASGTGGNDPMDTYSSQVATEYARKFLNGESKLLYPFGETFDLRRLGKLAGWCFPSPLGIDIHPTYGLWFAYRALLVVEQRLEPSEREEFDSPCEQCLDRPCQSACPAGAVGDIDAFNLTNCVTFRRQEQSPCNYRCLARLSCPVGSEYRYSKEQLNYHYGRSLATIRRYFESDSG